MRLLRPALAVFGFLVIVLIPLQQALAQEIQPTNVIKSPKDESFVLPYQAANRDIRNPVVYKYDQSKGQNWIFTVDDKLSYVPRNDSKVVITIKEPAPSEKYIQIFMYGGDEQKFVVAVNAPQTGYQIIESGNWVYEELVTLTHSDNSGLTVTDGKRIVVDRLDIQGFNPASIEVYGMDEAGALANAYGGTLGIGILYGSPSDTPVYYVPAAVMIGVGALMGVLLWKKKRSQ
ncbi:hypothetical protein [Nitrososphaera viennensis]|mgnify:CR=1 FL=1|uniref:Uncharacterized protein n=2 Tax=Nitrososphaera viennensis TaxID=1034015 RepID=A0A060HJR8_9ARCH|nr:hypothetical protein [Nitrososphaera viennensis]AIC15510.1 hypothetical protein NVIE_1297 [Nitrososphaera viennensis EN76]UVS70397.1 hypothetical protein NWT39_06325 [Nitrososphaera viennensis]